MHLSLSQVSVHLGDQRLISDFSLTLAPGERVAIVGKNGAGKSSLLQAIMGHPSYRLSGSAMYGSVDLSRQSADLRAHAGMFLAMQNVPEIPGVRMGEYLRTIHSEHLKRQGLAPLSPFLFGRFVRPLLAQVGLSESFLDRDLNVGFSGGEKRRGELLQMQLLSPSLVMIDEVDSGLDVGSVESIGLWLRSFLTEGRSALIVSHNPEFLALLEPTTTISLDTGSPASTL